MPITPNLLPNYGSKPIAPPPPPPPQQANLFQLDKGVPYPRQPIILGPTIGNEYLAVYPTQIINADATVTVGQSILLCDGPGPLIIHLPDVNTWAAEPQQGPHNPWEKTIWIKDVSGIASGANITIFPFTGQTIDKLTSFVINEDYGIVRLYPLVELGGWYAG